MDVAEFLKALANFGGVGMLAAVLFYLHTQALKAYREDLAIERKQSHEDHQQINERLDAQTGLLNELAVEIRYSRGVEQQAKVVSR